MIEVEHLSKHFTVPKRHGGRLGALRTFLSREHDVVRAVSDVSFKVERGEIVGYLGPNGAGKSTTIKMLAGLLVPTSGTLQVNGVVPWRSRRAFVANVGVVFGQRTTLWWDLPVIESLELLGHIYRVPKPRFEENLKTFTELLALDGFLNSPVRSLSLGQRMRADLAAALLHDPELLFLDEPTIGLDVVAKERIREFVAHVNETRGVTVLLTTHDLADVERLARRVMIIDHGQLLFDGKLAALLARFGGERHLVVEFAEPVADPTVEGARLVSSDSVRAVFAFRQDVSAATVIARLSARYGVRDLSVKEPDIEGTIRAIYEGGLLHA
ncbi:ABC transporter ATP-binding protein [Deinococcus yavapaiensis]|uniref:ABC-2 type transport system ATP-binding protein n=1 Tax=Deinococcus yavapaiensis KR-236 TaxID=694435 RepID=A0A318SM03_9DEIO|nr:ATP-binding cassette domain-containing protein [Deinococcus yavapaiensis]PYE55713.1 ABC-2 type transport system ATP-binding protein [Deinococcus yavapaiensis KR-236]